MSARPAVQTWLPLKIEGDALATEPGAESPAGGGQLLECVLERENLLQALKQVERNKGSAGVDGMEVEELRPYLKAHWQEIRGQLVAGQYQPQAVKRVEIPKRGGGKRTLGIPTVLDRFIQQAILQVLQAEWDPTFSAGSYGFQPGRSAHQAVRRAQEYLGAGNRWVVDIDLEKFFDWVDQEKLMGELRKRIGDQRVLGLIRRYLRAGALDHEALHETRQGTPQGGPLSPLLANVLLDGLDRELDPEQAQYRA